MNDRHFSSVIAKHIQTHKLTRENIVEQLSQSKFKPLNKCDITTLGRWLAGKTEPSLYKQCLVCIVLGIDLLDFIINLDPNQYKEPKRDKDVINNYINHLDNSPTLFSYFQRSNEIKIYYGFLENKKFRELLDPYFKNFTGYMELRKKVDAANIAVPFNVFIFKEHGHISGHLAFSETSKNYMQLFGIDSAEVHNSIGVSPMYYQDGKVFWYVISSLLYFFLRSNNYKRNIYATLSIRDRQTMEFFRHITDAENLLFFSPTEQASSNDKGQFFVQFNLVRALSTPTIVSQLQAFIKKHPFESFTPL